MSGAVTQGSLGNDATLGRGGVTELVHPARLQLSRRDVPSARPLESVDIVDFIDAMSSAVTGVSVVTTDGVGGRFPIDCAANYFRKRSKSSALTG